MVNLRKILFVISASICLISASSEENATSLLLTGASFAVPENGWFELACDTLHVQAINKGASGEAITHTAEKMYRSALYNIKELDSMEALVIMHVHDRDVADTTFLQEDYNNYLMPITNYAVAYDYVIKKYKADCYNLRNCKESKYYGSEMGKPAKIILCTHWHDSRITYNQSIRILSEKWKLPLVKWDEQIGFTKDVPDMAGRQQSLNFASDRQEQPDGVVYGWHPLRGKEQYIQQKLAEIFIQEIKRTSESQGIFLSDTYDHSINSINY